MILESIDFEITERCNFTCPHCYIRCTKKSDNELHQDIYLKIIDEMNPRGLQRIRMTGGEPLIRHDCFINVYKHAINHNIECHFNSNLTLLDDNIIKLLIPDLTTIQSSLYGWDSSSFDGFVGRVGAYSKFINNLDILNRKGINLQLRFPPLKPFLKNIHKLKYIAEQFNCNLKPIWKLSHKVANRDAKSYKYIRSHRPAPAIAAKMRLAQDDIAMHDIRKIFFKKTRPFLRNIDCVNFNNPRHVVVDSRGFLLNCFDLRHPSCKIKLSPDSSIYESIDKLIAKLKMIELNNSEYQEKCGQCVLRGACFFCPGLSYSETGKFDNSPVKYYCDISHYSAKLLGILEDGEKGWKIDFNTVKKRFFRKAGIDDDNDLNTSIHSNILI